MSYQFIPFDNIMCLLLETNIWSKLVLRFISKPKNNGSQ